ncbi:MAG TPA: hypothetical protein VML75_04855 [Kofleriaceae bacterium]|nr:hypothetical protein [Kofleriaceae bacterium]
MLLWSSMDILAMIMLPVLLLVVAVAVGSSSPWVGVTLGGLGLALFFIMRSLRTREHSGDTDNRRERRIRSLPDGDEAMPRGEPPIEHHREHHII